MKVLNGTEKLMQNGKELPIPIMEFWAWNSSDLLNNTYAVHTPNTLFPRLLSLICRSQGLIGMPMM